MRLGRVLYSVHGGIVAALGILTIFGRTGHFHVAAALLVLGLILSITIAFLTLFRRRGFTIGLTLLVFAAAPAVAAAAMAAHSAWTQSRWPGNRDCLHRLAETLRRDFRDVGYEGPVSLDAASDSSYVHARSPGLADRMRACGLIAVRIEQDQMEFENDLLWSAGGYVYRYEGSPELADCPYVLTGMDGKPGRWLEPRWYYCRGSMK